jgi:major vault protein
MRLSYNWKFNITKESENPSKIFSVRDFVGDMCNAIAARIRAAVAQEKFETFHKKSARLIRSSLFGINEQGKINDS